MKLSPACIKGDAWPLGLKASKLYKTVSCHILALDVGLKRHFLDQATQHAIFECYLTTSVMIADHSLLWLAWGLSLVLLLRCGRIQIVQPSLRCFACFSMEDRTLKILGSRQIFLFGGGSGFATAWQFVQVLCQAPSAAVHVSLVAMLREDRAGGWPGQVVGDAEFCGHSSSLSLSDFRGYHETAVPTPAPPAKPFWLDALLGDGLRLT